MSEIEIITDGGRRSRWSASEKLRIVEETLKEGVSISVVARRYGVASNLLYRWRCLMLDGRAVAAPANDDVTRNRASSGRLRSVFELERKLGRKTHEAEILSVSLANLHEGFADGANYGNHFGDAMRTRGGAPRIVATDI